MYVERLNQNKRYDPGTCNRDQLPFDSLSNSVYKQIIYLNRAICSFRES